MSQPKPYDGPLRWLVPSGSQPGESHLVQLDAYGVNGRCTCADFMCRHEPMLRKTPQLGGVDKTRCKHIRKVRGLFLDQIIAELAKKGGKALALMICWVNLSAAPSEAMLDALAMTETRNQPATVTDGGKALGAYCFHPCAWLEADKHRERQGLARTPYEAGAHCPVISREYARTLLGVYEARLKQRGLAPTPERLWLAWTMGWEGAKRIGFKARNAPAYKQRGLQRLTHYLGGKSNTSN